MTPHSHDHHHGHGDDAHTHGPHGGAAHHDHAHAPAAPGDAPQAPTRSLLMASSTQRVLGALGLIALLWMAVGWAVLSGD